MAWIAELTSRPADRLRWLDMVAGRRCVPPPGSPSTQPAAVLWRSHEWTSRKQSLVRCPPLGQRERSLRAVTNGWSYPTVLRQQALNRAMVLAKGTPNLIQRLSSLPTAPDVGPLRRRKAVPSSLSYRPPDILGSSAALFPVLLLIPDSSRNEYKSFLLVKKTTTKMRR